MAFSQGGARKRVYLTFLQTVKEYKQDHVLLLSIISLPACCPLDLPRCHLLDTMSASPLCCTQLQVHQ